MKLTKQYLCKLIREEYKKLTESVIKDIKPGKESGFAKGAIGNYYNITLSDGSIVEASDDELLERFEEYRNEGPMDIRSLTKLLLNKEWEDLDEVVTARETKVNEVSPSRVRYKVGDYVELRTGKDKGRKGKIVNYDKFSGNKQKFEIYWYDTKSRESWFLPTDLNKLDEKPNINKIKRKPDMNVEIIHLDSIALKKIFDVLDSFKIKYDYDKQHNTLHIDNYLNKITEKGLKQLYDLGLYDKNKVKIVDEVVTARETKVNEEYKIGDKVKLDDNGKTRIYTVTKPGLRHPTERLKDGEVYLTAPGTIGFDVDIEWLKKNQIKDDEEIEEISTTAGVAGYNTPYAFTKAKGDKEADKDSRAMKAMKKWGYTTMDTKNKRFTIKQK